MAQELPRAPVRWTPAAQLRDQRGPSAASLLHEGCDILQIKMGQLPGLRLTWDELVDPGHRSKPSQIANECESPDPKCSSMMPITASHREDRLEAYEQAQSRREGLRDMAGRCS